MDKMMLITQALAAAIRGNGVNWDGVCQGQDWQQLLTLAREHRIVPLVLEAVYRCPDFLAAEEQLKNAWKREAKAISAGQIVRSAAFVEVYGELRRAGLQPLVMKGMLCRRLYPNPDQRASADEDLLLQPAQFARAVTLLQEMGWNKVNPKASRDRDFEIGMVSPQGLLLELHQAPFSCDVAAEERYNRFFEKVHDQVENADGLLTMCSQDHMLYLLLHACKHFIHSGFGLRQVCDILLWAEQYGGQIDWSVLWEQCRQVHCLKFAQTVFAAAEAYLGFHPEKACLGEIPKNLPCEALMDDLLQAGIYGYSSGSRIHSATVTLHAVEAQHHGKKPSVMRSVFPGCKDLQGRYGYLQRHSWLLPVAWCSRWMRYAVELCSSGKENTPTESIKVGARRTELLRKLDIIE